MQTRNSFAHHLSWYLRYCQFLRGEIPDNFAICYGFNPRSHVLTQGSVKQKFRKNLMAGLKDLPGGQPPAIYINFSKLGDHQNHGGF